MFSVVTISYNSKNTIAQTFDSVLNQTYNKAVEYIVIDCGSTDGTRDIILNYEKRFFNKGIQFHWLSEPDNGIYDAMNKGILLSSGEIIGLLNSDDFYEPDALQNIMYAVKSHPDADIYYGFLRILMADGNELQVYRYCYENYLGKLGSGCESAAQHPTCFVKRTLYKRIGLFDLEFRTAADYDFLLRAKLNGASFKGLNNVISNFRNDGASNTISDFDRADQRFRTHLKYGLISIREFKQHLKRQRYRKYKMIKAKLVSLIFGEQ